MIFKGKPGNKGFFQKRCTAPASAKAGPHIYKRRKGETCARTAARGKTGGGGARAAGERRGPRHHRVYADVKGVNNANVFEKEEKKTSLFLPGNKTIMERSVQKVNSLS